MTSLKVLYARGKCKIHQNSINLLDLVELDVTNNTKINNVSHEFSKSLKVLYAAGKSNIDPKSIDQLNLIKLDIRYNYKITNLAHMKKLKKLYVDDKNRINVGSLKFIDISAPR